MISMHGISEKRSALIFAFTSYFLLWSLLVFIFVIFLAPFPCPLWLFIFCIVNNIWKFLFPDSWLSLIIVFLWTTLLMLLERTPINYIISITSTAPIVVLFNFLVFTGRPVVLLIIVLPYLLLLLVIIIIVVVAKTLVVRFKFNVQLGQWIQLVFRILKFLNLTKLSRDHIMLPMIFSFSSLYFI